MENNIIKKIDELDISKPWVWSLNITQEEYYSLEEVLCNSLQNSERSERLQDSKIALGVIVYLAEWYKRYYCSGNTNDKLSLSSEELKLLWESSGINPKIYVYKDDNGYHRWLYSIYVLGGLAIEHELQRNDDGKFLKGLCRIYHGEDYSFNNIDDETRSTAFRESIRQKHSLYEYIKSILNGKTNNKLASAIISANEEVYKQKFSLEWNVKSYPGTDLLYRELLLRQNPEEVGGGLHQYLRYDRVRLWGVVKPEKLKTIRAALRYLKLNNIVQEVNWDCPIISWSNTGNDSSGFITWGISQYVIDTKVPVEDFDTIELLIKTDDDQIFTIQKFQIPSYMQLWRKNSYEEIWGSRPNSQRQTVLLFKHPYSLKEGEAEQKYFIGTNQDKGGFWSWIYIYDNITIINNSSKSLTFYNRVGYDQITTRLYHHLLNYHNGGLVCHKYVEDQTISSKLSIEYLPIIWSKNDIIVRHFKNKDVTYNDTPELNTKIESIEFKQPNGRYIVWDNNNQPSFGFNILRITVKGRTTILRLLYLEPLKGEIPLIRDCDNNKIIYANNEFHDNIEVQLNHKPLEKSQSIKIGSKNDYVELDVWRPTNLKEVILNNKVVSYSKDVVKLPYILKNETIFDDFGSHGYIHYNCKNLTGIYNLPDLNTGKRADMEAWKSGKEFLSKSLDQNAPDNLRIVFGNPEVDKQSAGDVEFFNWDYDKNKKPNKVPVSTKASKNTIIFQSLKNINSKLENHYPSINIFPFGYNKVKQRMSYIKCFEIALEHRLYFIMLEPFTHIKTLEDFKDKIYDPLLKIRNGLLSEKEQQGVRRFIEEFQFNSLDCEFDVNNDKK